MRFLKLPILSFIFLFLLVTGISLFIPSRVRVSKAIDINTSREEVMQRIRDPLDWRDWYPGADSMSYYYEDGLLKGFIIDSSTKQFLAIGEKNDSMVIAVIERTGKKPVQITWMSIEHNPTSITLHWYMDFHLRWYPWEKFSSLFFEKIYGAQMERGLLSLKQLAESAVPQ